MKNQIIAMLKLQNDMNTKVHEDWREQNFEWYRAIWVECAELLDHYGWKWWKKQSPDREQVILELIDIWHFGLSDLLMKSDDLDGIARNLEIALNEQGNSGDFREQLESFASDTLNTQSFNPVLFNRLLQGMDQNFDDLYRKYIGKNVLNFFRQDHGYKTGEYQKVWSGREDNEHLVELLESLNTGDENFQQAVYRGLKERYPG